MPRRGQQLPRANYAQAVSPSPLYHRNALAGRPCIYLRIEIYRGRAAGRRAVPFARARALPPIRDSGFALYEQHVAHLRAEMSNPAPFEFEYRYFGGRDGREKRAGIYHGNFPPFRSRVGLMKRKQTPTIDLLKACAALGCGELKIGDLLFPGIMFR